MSTIHDLAADIAGRIPEMQRDSITNNCAVIETLLKQAFEPTIQVSQSELQPTISLRQLTSAVMSECSCGGGGPDDKHTCQACKVYHRLRAN